MKEVPKWAVPGGYAGYRKGSRVIVEMVRVSDLSALIEQAREDERERVCSELQKAFDHILKVESKLPGLYELFDRVFTSWERIKGDDSPSA